MIKPADWDTTEAFTGEFKQIKPGGYVCRILAAKTELTKTRKEQLVIMFDIVEGEFKDFYRDQYEKKHAKNADAQWSGVYRQLTGGEANKTNPFFKGMIASIESSNNGYTWNWNEETLKGKLFGGVFGQEEFESNTGDIKVATKLMFIRSVEQVRKGVEVPEIKRLKQTGNLASSYFGADVIPEEEVPF